MLTIPQHQNTAGFKKKLGNKHYRLRDESILKTIFRDNAGRGRA